MNSKKTFPIIAILIVLGVALLAYKSMNNDKGDTGDTANNLPSSTSGDVQITPVDHASMVLKWGGKVIYTDPVGGAAAFAGQSAPDMILVTDIHGDHMDPATLSALSKASTTLIVPKAVADELPDSLMGTVVVLRNGENTSQLGFNIDAVPMYNLPQSTEAYHTKGRGNGYVLEAGGKRIYISGDTSGIPEMRQLQNIDIAFVCMNLPYTMSVEEAADAVLAFKPKQVYPYHYKGESGLSDVNKFKQLVNAGNPDIDVVLLNWYPKGI